LPKCRRPENVQSPRGAYTDHGNVGESTQRHAYAVASVYGVEVLAPLAGLEAHRETVPS